MDRPVFLISSYARKPKFQIQTRAIKSKSGNISFQKIALSKEAEPHLLSIKKTSDLLVSEGLGPLFSKAVLSKDSVKFEQEAGDSLEDLLFTAVMSNNTETVLRLLDEYEAFLKNLQKPKHKHLHKYSEEIFGPNFFTKFNESDCIYPGILDLNFDNILKAGQQLKSIDYEWAFLHCLPHDYVLARSIMWFGVRYADIFKMHSQRINIIALSDEVVLPLQIFNEYSELMPLLKDIYSIEWTYFQRWVNGSFQKTLAAFYAEPIKYVQKTNFALDKLEEQMHEVAQLNAENARLADELAAKSTEIERQNKVLRQTPHRAVSGAYKVGRKVKHSIKSKRSR